MRKSRTLGEKMRKSGSLYLHSRSVRLKYGIMLIPTCAGIRRPLVLLGIKVLMAQRK